MKVPHVLTCLEHLYVEIVQFLIDSNLFASLLRLKFMDPAAGKKDINLNKLSEISTKTLLYYTRRFSKSSLDIFLLISYSKQT